MARRLRHDRPGGLYHVMNRGIARRTIFDTAADCRFFLACLACAVRRGEVEVLAYALMRTHFHLLLRSHGGLSAAMRRVQLRHVRRFNRLHRRDGPLMRGRFLSKRVEGLPYERNVVYYTHENPVLAGLCDVPQAYPWCSAWLATQAHCPAWFSMDAIRRHGIVRGGGAVPDRSAMLARAELVEARLRARGTEDDLPLDGDTPERVLAWMKRKARLADGIHASLPIVGPATLAATIEVSLSPEVDAVTPVPGGGTHRTRDLLLAGLLRDVCCASYVEIATVAGTSISRAKRLRRLHARCVEQLEHYASFAAGIVQAALARLEEGA